MVLGVDRGYWSIPAIAFPLTPIPFRFDFSVDSEISHFSSFSKCFLATAKFIIVAADSTTINIHHHQKGIYQ